MYYVCFLNQNYPWYCEVILKYDQDEEDDDDENDDGNEEREKKKNWHTKRKIMQLNPNPNPSKGVRVGVCCECIQTTTYKESQQTLEQQTLFYKKANARVG